MADKDTRPILYFDFGARETQETLRTRLLLEAEICLASAGRPQRQLLEELRSYIVKNKSSDARIYPILRIIHRYCNVTPTDFRDLMKLIGVKRSLEFIDGIRPPQIVWNTINELRDTGAPVEYVAKFWDRILDGIEAGADNEQWYVQVCHDYLYTNPGTRRPGNRQSLSSSR